MFVSHWRCTLVDKDVNDVSLIDKVSHSLMMIVFHYNVCLSLTMWVCGWRLVCHSHSPYCPMIIACLSLSLYLSVDSFSHCPPLHVQRVTTAAFECGLSQKEGSRTRPLNQITSSQVRTYIGDQSYPSQKAPSPECHWLKLQSCGHCCVCVCIQQADIHSLLDVCTFGWMLLDACIYSRCVGICTYHYICVYTYECCWTYCMYYAYVHTYTCRCVSIICMYSTYSVIYKVVSVIATL